MRMLLQEDEGMRMPSNLVLDKFRKRHPSNKHVDMSRGQLDKQEKSSGLKM